MQASFGRAARRSWRWRRAHPHCDEARTKRRAGGGAAAPACPRQQQPRLAIRTSEAQGVSKVEEVNHARTHSNATPRAAHTRRARTWFTGVMPLVCSTALAAKFGVAAAAPVERTCDLRCSEQAVPHLSCLGEVCWRENGCLSPYIAPANRVACSHILESTAAPAS